MNYKDCRPLLVVLGVAFLLAGAAAAFLGPVELYVLAAFSPGGRFYYEGFGFGSFMFGNITAQIAAYYLVAAIGLSLGYGHLRARRWARTLTLTVLCFWLVVGVPLTPVLMFMLLTVKDLSLLGGVILVIAGVLVYPVGPVLLIWLYRSRDLRLTFERRDPRSYWTETTPLPVLVLGTLYAFYVLVLHAPIFFRGLFPFFGTWFEGQQGVFGIALCILGQGALVWGTIRRRTWAWWGGLGFLALLALSAVLTLCRSSWAGILALLRFPPTEMEALDGLPLQGWHLAVLVGLPLLATMGLLLSARRHFGRVE